MVLSLKSSITLHGRPCSLHSRTASMRQLINQTNFNVVVVLSSYCWRFSCFFAGRNMPGYIKAIACDYLAAVLAGNSELLWITNWTGYVIVHVVKLQGSKFG